MDTRWHPGLRGCSGHGAGKLAARQGFLCSGTSWREPLDPTLAETAGLTFVELRAGLPQAPSLTQSQRGAALPLRTAWEALTSW